MQDLISRQAAINADATIEEIKARNPDDVSYEDAWAITCIEHAPTIEPERTGKWIIDHLVSTGGGTYQVLRCDKCGHTEAWQMGRNYCPNCGARMEKNN